MKKTDKGANKRLQRFKGLVVNHRGPMGLRLLAEILNWDSKSIDPKKFGEGEFRRGLICLLATGGLNMLPTSDDWREKLRAIQDEIRNDMLGLLRPSRPVEQKPWVPTSARAASLGRLLQKLFNFKWKEHLTFYPTKDTGNKSKIISLGISGEMISSTASLEIAGETFSLWERVFYSDRFDQGFRERCYRIIYDALKSGEISKFRHCQRCDRFFVGRKKECSNKCRTAINNELRRKTGYFRKRYEKQKADALARAKRLLKNGEKIKDVERLTGLKAKMLERAGIS